MTAFIMFYMGFSERLGLGWQWRVESWNRKGRTTVSAAVLYVLSWRPASETLGIRAPDVSAYQRMYINKH